MRTALAGLLLGLLVLAWPWPSDAGPTPVGSVMGGNVVCDPAVTTCLDFPLSAAFLCDGTGAILDCPQYFAPDWADTTGTRFFGLTNRTNPPRCVQSTDGGTVWGLCPSNPYSAAVDLLGAFFTVASDGSLIAAADQGANNCIIRRSTDYGTSWTTVFTDTTATSTCGVSFGFPTPSVARCASNSGYCAVIGRTTGSFDLFAYFSTDNGATWTKGTTFNVVSTDEQIGMKVGNDGGLGILARFQVAYDVRTFAVKSGNNFVVTGVVPQPPGAGASTRCPAVMIFTTTPENRTVLCGPDSVFTTTYRRFDVIGLAPTQINTFIPQNAPTSAQAPTMIATSFGVIGYMIGRNGASTQVLIHISLDGFASAPLLSSLTPATALVANCCPGDIHVWNGRIYFSSGATGANAFLVRIQ